MKTIKARRQIFDFLKLYGFVTPANGTVRDISEKFDRRTYVVVYFDNFISRMTIEEALCGYKDDFCSIYVPDARGLVLTRAFHIGSDCHEVVYRGEDWKITKRNTKSRAIRSITTNNETKITYPLYSIDFIESKDQRYAIDLDFQVDIKKTGISNNLTKEQSIVLIRKAYNRHYSNDGFKF